jgi:hypothetical protein
VDGNDARFFNHSCDPNCESTVEKRRVYIEALRDIEAGAELTYDYQIQREDDDPDNIDEVFACRCGFTQCRGTMLWPTERKPKRSKPKKKARTASAKSTGTATRTSRKKTKTAAASKTKTAARKRAAPQKSSKKKKSKRGGRSR